jgi:hypothetical protein
MRFSMAKFTVDIDLTESEQEQFDRYLDDKCYDPNKWLRQQVYTIIKRAAGKYKQPRGTVNPAFKKPDTAKGRGKK